MTLAQHRDSSVFHGERSERKPAAIETRRPHRNLADVAAEDGDADRLARRLRDEWRRERYARMTDV